MQTAINNHHIEPIHTSYCGYSFFITKKKMYDRTKLQKSNENISVSHEV